MNKRTSKFLKIFLFLFVFNISIFVLMIPIAFGSSWPAASNLTQNETDSVYPSIAGDMNGNLHVVWQDTDSKGNQEIYYRKFSAATGTWGSIRNISNTPYVSSSNTGNSDQPAVSADRYGNVHVVWMDYLNGNIEIYYVKYNNATGTWESRVNISNTLTPSLSPSITSDSLGNLYVVWEDNGDIYYIRNVGGSWGPKQLISSIIQEQRPKIAVAMNGRISVVWEGEVQHQFEPPQWHFEVFYNQSADGVSWSGVQQLSASSPNDSLNSGVATDANSNIYVVWESQNEIYSRKSSSGLSWGTLENLSNTGGTSKLPSIASDQVGNVHLVWSEYAANWEIYYKKFSGSSWGSNTNISNTTGMSWTPSITADAAANPKVVWEDDSAYPNVAFDVYYSGLSGPIDIYSTGFEQSSLPGWNFGDWYTSAPAGSDYWGRTNISGAARSGSYGLWCATIGTNSTAGGLPNTSVRKYDNDMNAYARLSVDLTPYQSANLSFYYKVPSLEEFDPPHDMGWLFVRDISGNKTLATLSYFNTVVSDWQKQTFDLSEFAGQSIILDWVWITDNDSWVAEGMYIDDITVTGMPLSVMVVSPNVRSNDKAYTITITGTGFKATPTVTIGDTPASSVTRVDATKLTAQVPAGLPYGTYDVKVTNPGDASATLYYGFKVSIPGDVNGDGTVNIFDLVLVGKAFGSTPSSPNWNANADANGDNQVNIFDLVIVGKNFGKSL